MNRRRRSAVFALLGALVVVVSAVVAGNALGETQQKCTTTGQHVQYYDSNGQPQDSATGAAKWDCQADASVDYGPQKSPDQCVDGFNIAPDEHKANQVISNGGTVTPASPELDTLLYDVNMHDPAVLMLYYNSSPPGKADPVGSVQDLVDSGCYSTRGRDAYNQWKGAWQSAVKTPDTAPATGVNSGVANGQPFQEAAGPIGGDRTATKVVYPNGDTMWVLHRCKNVETNGTPIPNIPPKEVVTTTTTPTTRPGSTTTVPRTTTTVCAQPPPGQTGCGKDATKDVLVNPAVPDQVKGCSGTSDHPAGTAPCQGNTAGPAHPAPVVTAPPAPPAPPHTSPPPTTAPHEDPPPVTQPAPPVTDPPPPSTTPTGPCASC
jgi:hypothetical protein